MRRRWKLRLLWAAVLFGVLLLAIPATVAQTTAAIRVRANGIRTRGFRSWIQVIWLKRIRVTVSSSPISRL
jgi:hypothetical protein